MRLLVCGSTRWTDVATIERELRALKPNVVIHGNTKGAGGIAHVVARDLGIVVFACPEIRETDINPKYLDRVLAFGALWWLNKARGLWGRTGTGDMVARLLEARLPVRWVPAPGAAAVELTTMPTPEEHEGLARGLEQRAGGGR